MKISTFLQSPQLSFLFILPSICLAAQDDKSPNTNSENQKKINLSAVFQHSEINHQSTVSSNVNSTQDEEISQGVIGTTADQNLHNISRIITTISENDTSDGEVIQRSDRTRFLKDIEYAFFYLSREKEYNNQTVFYKLIPLNKDSLETIEVGSTQFEKGELYLALIKLFAELEEVYINNVNQETNEVQSSFETPHFQPNPKSEDQQIPDLDNFKTEYMKYMLTKREKYPQIGLEIRTQGSDDPHLFFRLPKISNERVSASTGNRKNMDPDRISKTFLAELAYTHDIFSVFCKTNSINFKDNAKTNESTSNASAMDAFVGKTSIILSKEAQQERYNILKKDKKSKKIFKEDSSKYTYVLSCSSNKRKKEFVMKEKLYENTKLEHASEKKTKPASEYKSSGIKVSAIRDIKSSNLARLFIQGQDDTDYYTSDNDVKSGFSSDTESDAVVSISNGNKTTLRTENQHASYQYQHARKNRVTSTKSVFTTDDDEDDADEDNPNTMLTKDLPNGLSQTSTKKRVSFEGTTSSKISETTANHNLAKSNRPMPRRNTKSKNTKASSKTKTSSQIKQKKSNKKSTDKSNNTFPKESVVIGIVATIVLAVTGWIYTKQPKRKPNKQSK